MENFKTEVNAAPGAKVQFELHYQEVKWRKLGSYEHRLHLQPGRLAKHLEVSVMCPVCSDAILTVLFLLLFFFFLRAAAVMRPGVNKNIGDAW